MTTVVFVHGTGVRQPAYEATLGLVSEKLAKVRPKCVVAQCYWGGTLGSRLNADGISIPSGRSGRNPADELFASADDSEIALWEFLERDPLFELALLSATPGASPELAPHARPPGRRLANVARQLPTSATVVAQAAIAGLEHVLPQSIEAILESPVTAKALLLEYSLQGTLRIALSRAIVANAMRCADVEFGATLPLDGQHRDALVAILVSELGGTDRSIGSVLGRLATNAALTLGASRPAERRRVAITEASAPASGDVLLYLVRGEALRDFIAQVAAKIDDEVVLLAHSLGGIASLDTLATRLVPNVVQLVTFGSQAPFLYELNALPSLPYGEKLPVTVPKWVNIFDRRDLLAFTASGVFPNRVSDLEVDCRAPFPRSHSAYVAHDGFYSLLDEVIP